MAKKKATGVLDLSAIAAQVTGKDLNTTFGDSPTVLSTIAGNLSTGSISSDVYLGGGFALGRMHEIYGMQGSGKTAVALQVVKSCQDQGGVCFWAATEVGSWDVPRAKAFGLDLSRVIVSSPEYLEKLFEYTYNIVKVVYNTIAKQNPDIPVVLVIDSVNASPMKSLVATGNVYADGMASRQRALADFMKLLEIPLSKTKIAIIFINQISANIGAKWGAPGVKSAGTGNQFFHHLSTSLFLDYKGRSDSGQTVKLTLRKLRTERPHTKWTTFMWYYYGALEHHELFNIAVEYGLLEKKGGWTYDTAEEGIPRGERMRWQSGWAGLFEIKSSDSVYYQNLLARSVLCLRRTVRHRDEELVLKLDKQYSKLVDTLRLRAGKEYVGQSVESPKVIAPIIDGEEEDKTEANAD